MLAAYAAGLMDGEGCFRIDKFATERSPIGYQYRSTVEIVMCDEAPIKEIAEATGRNYWAKRIKSGRTAYVLSWRNGIAANVIRSVLPYLRGKKEQAELCLYFEDHITPGRGRTYKPEHAILCEEYRDRVAVLKRVGAPRC